MASVYWNANCVYIDKAESVNDPKIVYCCRGQLINLKLKSDPNLRKQPIA